MQSSMQRHSPSIREVDDVLALVVDKQDIFKPDWRIFLPTIVVLLLYAIGLLIMWIMGMGQSALFRLFVLVVAIGVPILAVHAFLRYSTVRVQILDDRIRYHPGWPKDIKYDIPRELITRIHVRRGLSGMIFGGGTLIAETSTGNQVAVADLANPMAALARYEGREESQLDQDIEGDESQS